VSFGKRQIGKVTGETKSARRASTPESLGTCRPCRAYSQKRNAQARVFVDLQRPSCAHLHDSRIGQLRRQTRFYELSCEYPVVVNYWMKGKFFCILSSLGHGGLSQGHHAHFHGVSDLQDPPAPN